MLTFNTENLNRSSFKGVSFYTNETSLESGKRLTVHKFIDSGTDTEENGNDEKSFTISGYVTGTDYLIDKNNLIDALDSKGSGVLIDSYYGEIEVYVDTYSVRESSNATGRANFSIKFIKAENKLEQTEFIAMNRNTALDDAVFSELSNVYNPNIGIDMLAEIVTTAKEMYELTNDIVKFIESDGTAKDSLQSIIKTIIDNTNIESVKNVDNIVNDIKYINEGLNNFYAENDLSEDDMKASSNSLFTAINNVNEIDETTLDETEKIVLINKKAMINANTLVNLQSLNEQLNDLEFTTGDSFGETKEDNLLIFEILNNELIEENSLNELKNYKVTYIDFITQKYSSLQNLETLNQVGTTNVLSLSLNKYNDIGRINEIMDNNDILDPLFINGEIQVLNK